MGADNNEIKQAAKKRLDAMLEDLDGSFDANDHMMVKTDIPGNNDVKPYVAKDYNNVMGNIKAQAELTVAALAKNYLLEEDLMRLGDKTTDALLHQARTLADAEFMIEECREMAQTIRGYIDSGDLSQQMFATHRGYMTDLQSHIQSRIKILRDFEDYWKKIAADAGLMKTKESDSISSSPVKEEKEEDSGKKIVMTTDALLRRMDAARKIKTEEREKNRQ